MKKRKSINTNMILALFGFIVIIPAATLVVWIFIERWVWPDILPQTYNIRALAEILERKDQLIQIFMSSIMISTVVAFLSVVIGIMTARALTVYEFRGRSLMYFFSVLPFMVPATVFAMGIQITFIKLGLNNSIAGVVIAHLICSLPYAVRLLMEATRAVGTGLEQQARVLGASAWQAFYKVTLPVLLPVLLSSMSMAYIVSFSQYFLTLLIGGGRIKTFTIVMVPYLQGGDRNIACIYSVIFLSITLVIFGVFEWIAGRWSKENSAEFYI